METSSDAGRRPMRSAAWTVEECALFAARKQFELLRLLSVDAKAFSTLRRLCFALAAGHPQPQPHSHSQATATSSRADRAASAATPSSARLRRRPRRRSARSARRRQPHGQSQPHTAAAQAAHTRQPRGARLVRGAAQAIATDVTARRRRSAARSAQHHARVRQQAWSRIRNCLVFIARLKRAVAPRVCAGGSAGQMAEMVCCSPPSPSKRGRDNSSDALQSPAPCAPGTPSSLSSGGTWSPPTLGGTTMASMLPHPAKRRAPGGSPSPSLRAMSPAAVRRTYGSDDFGVEAFMAFQRDTLAAPPQPLRPRQKQRKAGHRKAGTWRGR